MSEDIRDRGDGPDAGPADEDDEIFAVECILAESFDAKKRKPSYLIKWESLDLFESSWETASAFEEGGDAVLADWEAVKSKQAAGTLMPFDVNDFEVKRAAWYRRKDKEERALERLAREEAQQPRRVSDLELITNSQEKRPRNGANSDGARSPKSSMIRPDQDHEEAEEFDEIPLDMNHHLFRSAALKIAKSNPERIAGKRARTQVDSGISQVAEQRKKAVVDAPRKVIVNQIAKAQGMTTNESALQKGILSYLSKTSSTDPPNWQNGIRQRSSYEIASYGEKASFDTTVVPDAAGLVRSPESRSSIPKRRVPNPKKRLKRLKKPITLSAHHIFAYESTQMVQPVEVGTFIINGLNERLAQALQEGDALIATEMTSSRTLAQTLAAVDEAAMICTEVIINDIPSAFWKFMDTLRLFDCAAVVRQSRFTAFLYRKQDQHLKALGSEALRLQNSICRIVFLLDTAIEALEYDPEDTNTPRTDLSYRWQLAASTGFISPDFQVDPEQTVLILGPECSESNELHQLLQLKLPSSNVLNSRSEELTKLATIHHVFVHRLLVGPSLGMLSVLTRLKQSQTKFWLYGAQVSIDETIDHIPGASIFQAGVSIQVTSAATCERSARVLAACNRAKAQFWQISIPHKAFHHIQEAGDPLLAIEFRSLLEKERIIVNPACDEDDALSLSLFQQIDLMHKFRCFVVLCKDDEEVSKLLASASSGGIEVMTLDEFEDWKEVFI